MRVLHVIPRFTRSHGGPATALAGLAAAQKRAGLDVAVASTFKTGDTPELAEQLRAEGVPVTMIGPVIGPLQWCRAIRPMLEAMVRFADVVHIHTLFESIQHAAAVLARKHDKPYIMRPCGMLDPWSLAQRPLKKKLYLALRLRRDLNDAAAIHYTTDTERDVAATLELRAPAVVVPNGVDLSEFDTLPARDAFRSRHPAIGNRRLVLFLGRVDAKKGFDVLIPAFARTQPADAMLVIAGPDLLNYRAQVEQMVRDHAVADRVIFTGMLQGPQRVEAFAAADLFVLPSYSENFGIAVVEALAAGCPVIVSDQVNLHAEVTAGRVGESVPLDIARLADAMTRWLNDDALRSDAAARASQFVHDRYDWRVIAQTWAQQYDALTRVRSK